MHTHMGVAEARANKYFRVLCDDAARTRVCGKSGYGERRFFCDARVAC